MRSEPTRVGGIPPKQDKNFPYEDAQVGQPGKLW